MNDLRVSFPKPCSETWDRMRPDGCNRHCARCDKTIHDLAHLTLNQAEALLRSGEGVCVRARIDADGLVGLKADGKRNSHRMITLGVCASLFSLNGQAIAGARPPRGMIAGTVETVSWKVVVTATGEDGKKYRTRVRSDGRYKIKNLPYGTYALEFSPDCGDSWKGGQVVVQNSEITVERNKDPNQCIVIGMIEIGDHTV